MGGPSTQPLTNISNLQEGAAATAGTQSAQDRAQMQQLEQPQINFLQGIAGGDATRTLQAAAPLIGNISSGYNAAKESIMNAGATAGGTGGISAAQQYALTQLPVQQGAQTAQALNSTYLGALDKLTNVGAGLGSFSIQELGAQLSGLQGASTTQQAAINAQEQAKASTMGFLGSIVGAAGTAAGGGAFGHL